MKEAPEIIKIVSSEKFFKNTSYYEKFKCLVFEREVDETRLEIAKSTFAGENVVFEFDT